MCSRKWLIVTLVACALASACSDYNTNLSIQTASSTLVFVSPSTATVGGQSFTITANGTGFTTGALILWNGTALNTTLVSATQLTAPVPASDIATVGTAQVAVQIPGSAQSPTQNIYATTTTEISNVVIFTINTTPGTPPAVTSLSASTTAAASTPYCSTQGFTLTVNGTNFTSDAIVNWNGAAQPTTFVSATQLTAAIAAASAAFPGKAGVSVTNSLGTSNSLPLTLSTPGTGLAAPSIGSLSQTSAPVASSDLALTVTGTNILPCSVVQWVSPGNVTSNLATTYVSTTQLTATIPAADFLAAGNAELQLFTLTPGGGTSTQIPFSIMAPSISGLSSSTTSSNTTPSCSPSAATLTVTGLNFVNSSVVDWIIPATGSSPAITTALATTFVSSTQLTATIPVSDIASAGSVTIEVSNLGAFSNSLGFTISAASPPAPTITTLSPAGATAGTAAVTLTVSGTNLLPCSVVQWTNGSTTTPLVTTYVAPTQTSAAQLNATIPATEIASIGTTQIAVASPASSANTSNSVSFPITLATLTSLSASTTSSGSTPYCSSTGFTLTVNGTGFANGLVVNWNGSPRPTTLVSATQLTAAISPADTAFLATTTAAVAITVSGGNPGTNSNSLKFALTALTGTASLPQPALSSISPSNAAVEASTGPPVPLSVNGSGFSPCSVVQWNGASLPASIFIGTSGMASVIPAANITAAGTDQVTVATPAPGGGTSGSQTFTVYTPGSPGSNKISGAALSLPLMSADQRYTVYVLASTDGVTESPGTTQNIFVNDTCTGVASGCTASTTLVSAGLSNAAANGDSISPAISGAASADGRYVSFLSSATNLVSGVTNGVVNGYVRDTCIGAATGCTPTTQLVSVTTGGTQANGATTSATIDPTGRYIIFESAASNLGAVSSSGGIFLRDTCAGVASGCTPSTQPLD
jgi:trimeric autotransporter adhesin